MTWQRKTPKGDKLDPPRRQDLNPKFVLQVYRDFKATEDKTFLKLMWPLVRRALKHCKEKFDPNYDGMLENVGCDQIYDTWPAFKCSVYTGGLWVAALKAAKVMAYYRKDISHYVYFDDLYKKASRTFIDELWNGKYFNYDNSDSPHHDSIMADQMVCNWYSISCGLGRIVPPEQVQSALSQIYEKNVCAFNQGKLGAVNGVKPDGTVDKSCLHSQEVWPGVTYGLAAAMLQVGLTEEAFKMISDFIDNSYNNLGYIYQTPLSLNNFGHYRGSTNMLSSLSIWALQWCYEWEINHQSSEHVPSSDEYDLKFEKTMASKVAMMNEKQTKRRTGRPNKTPKQAQQLEDNLPDDGSLLNSVRTKVTRSLSFMF